MKSKTAALLFTLLITVSPLFAQESDEKCLVGVEQLSAAFRQAAAKALPAVVYIEVTMQGGVNFWGRTALQTGSGSGVIIDAENGYVLTANHVVENAVRVVVKLNDGRELEATEFRNDPRTEVAIVKIPADNLPCAQIGNSDEVQVGDWVLAIGSPMGELLANSVSAGIISAKGRRTGILSREQGIEDFIQTDAAINRGNSGGPLININGEVIGINSNIVSASGMSVGLGFAVPSNLAKRSIEDLISKGRVVRGYLGVRLSSLEAAKSTFPEKFTNDDIARGGVYIVETVPDGPAQSSGLLPGDIIIEIDETQIKTPEDLIKIVSLSRPDQEIECVIIRQGKEQLLNVKLGQHQEDVQVGYEQQTGKKLAADTVSFKKLGVMVEQADFRVWGLGGFEKISGIQIKYVKPDSVAYEYGIEQDDIITDVEGQKVRTIEDFEKAIENADFDRGVEMIILDRSGKHRLIIRG